MKGCLEGEEWLNPIPKTSKPGKLLARGWTTDVSSTVPQLQTWSSDVKGQEKTENSASRREWMRICSSSAVWFHQDIQPSGWYPFMVRVFNDQCGNHSPLETLHRHSQKQCSISYLGIALSSWVHFSSSPSWHSTYFLISVFQAASIQTPHSFREKFVFQRASHAPLSLPGPDTPLSL